MSKQSSLPELSLQMELDEAATRAVRSSRSIRLSWTALGVFAGLVLIAAVSTWTVTPHASHAVSESDSRQTTNLIQGFAPMPMLRPARSGAIGIARHSIGTRPAVLYRPAFRPKAFRGPARVAMWQMNGAHGDMGKSVPATELPPAQLEQLLAKPMRSLLFELENMKDVVPSPSDAAKILDKACEYAASSMEANNMEMDQESKFKQEIKLQEVLSDTYKSLEQKGILRGFGSCANALAPLKPAGTTMSGNLFMEQDLLKATGLQSKAFSPPSGVGFPSLVLGSLTAYGLLGAASSLALPVAPVGAGLFGLLGVDSILFRGAIQDTIVKTVNPKYREVVLQHEAGHLLVAYLMGNPIQGCLLDSWAALKDGRFGGVQAGTIFYDPELGQNMASGKLSRTCLDRYSIVVMAGIAAEAMKNGQAEGGSSDEDGLIRLLIGLDGGQTWDPARIQSQARWGASQAFLLLRDHASAYEDLCNSLREGATIGKAIMAIEGALAKEPELPAVTRMRWTADDWLKKGAGLAVDPKIGAIDAKIIALDNKIAGNALRIDKLDPAAGAKAVLDETKRDKMSLEIAKLDKDIADKTAQLQMITLEKKDAEIAGADREIVEKSANLPEPDALAQQDAELAALDKEIAEKKAKLAAIAAPEQKDGQIAGVDNQVGEPGSKLEELDKRIAENAAKQEVVDKQIAEQELAKKNEKLQEIAQKEAEIAAAAQKDEEIAALDKEILEKNAKLQASASPAEKKAEIAALDKAIAELTAKTLEPAAPAVKVAQFAELAKLKAERKAKLEPMIAPVHEEPDAKIAVPAQKDAKIAALAQKDAELAAIDKEIAEKNAKLQEIAQKEAEIVASAQNNVEVAAIDKEIAEKNAKLQEIAQKEAEISASTHKDAEVAALDQEIATKDANLQESASPAQKEAELAASVQKDSDIVALDEAIAEQYAKTLEPAAPQEKTAQFVVLDQLKRARKAKLERIDALVQKDEKIAAPAHKDAEDEMEKKEVQWTFPETVANKDTPA